MTDVEATYEDFIASRRSGRRNAIHEMPPGAADLSQSLEQLSISKAGEESGDLEKSQDCPAKEEAAEAEGS